MSKTQRLYFLNPKDATAREDAARFLRAWGIVPVPGRDEEGDYLSFSRPDDWPFEKARRFAAAYRQRVSVPLSGDDGVRATDYPCPWCRKTDAAVLCDCQCGHLIPACSSCLEEDRIEACKGCGVPFTPRSWPDPPKGQPQDILATSFAKLFSRHLTALVRAARRCEEESDTGDEPSATALAQFLAIGRRLYDLEVAWAEAGVGLAEGRVSLTEEQAKLRAAALEFGAALKEEARASERVKALVDVMLEAGEPFMAG